MDDATNTSDDTGRDRPTARFRRPRRMLAAGAVAATSILALGACGDDAENGDDAEEELEDLGNEIEEGGEDLGDEAEDMGDEADEETDEG